MDDQTPTSTIKSRSQQIVEQRLGEPIDAALRRLYVDRGLTQAEVARLLGVSRQTVVGWMAQAGIESRQTPTVSAEAVA